MTQLLQFAWVEADKRANNQVGTVLLDTLYTLHVASSILLWEVTHVQHPPLTSEGHILSSKHGFLPDLIIWQSMFWDIRRGWRNSWLREGYEIFTSSHDSLTFSHPPSGLEIDLNLWPKNFPKIDFQTFSKSRPRETNS